MLDSNLEALWIQFLIQSGQLKDHGCHNDAPWLEL